MLEASNEPDVIASINNAKAADALDLIQKALLGRLVVGVTGALAPRRDPGDFHLRVGMDLIREEVPRQTILLKGGALKLADIETAERRWAECLDYEARAPCDLSKQSRCTLVGATGRHEGPDHL